MHTHLWVLFAIFVTAEKNPSWRCWRFLHWKVSSESRPFICWAGFFVVKLHQIRRVRLSKQITWTDTVVFTRNICRHVTILYHSWKFLQGMQSCLQRPLLSSLTFDFIKRHTFKTCVHRLTIFRLNSCKRHQFIKSKKYHGRNYVTIHCTFVISVCRYLNKHGPGEI